MDLFSIQQEVCKVVDELVHKVEVQDRLDSSLAAQQEADRQEYHIFSEVNATLDLIISAVEFEHESEEQDSVASASAPALASPVGSSQSPFPFQQQQQSVSRRSSVSSVSSTSSVNSRDCFKEHNKRTPRSMPRAFSPRIGV